MIRIRSYVRITHNKAIRDGKVIFEHDGQSPLLDALFDSTGVVYPKFFKMDDLSRAGFLGAELLIGGLTDPLNDPATAVILSNSVSSLDTDMRYWQTVSEHASPSLFVYTLPNIVAGEICIRHGFKGESIFFVTPSFSPQWLASYVDAVMSENTNTCIAGWVEVLNGHADVLLYLADRSEAGGVPHIPSKISEIYHLWNSSWLI